MTLGSPVSILVGLVCAIVAGAVIGVVVLGELSALAIAGAVIAYGLVVLQSHRLGQVERTFEPDDDSDGR